MPANTREASNRAERPWAPNPPHLARTEGKPADPSRPALGARAPSAHTMLRVASTRATLRLQPPARHAKGQCSFLPLHRRVEAAAARNDLDECRRLLTHDPRVLISVESNRPEASANSPSSMPRQHQIKLRAASSIGQPQPIGRYSLAGRPYRLFST